MEEKKWFISKDSETRWVKVFINKNIKWDHCGTHLVVSMDSDLNEAHKLNDVRVESIDIKNFFNTKEESQMEIIRRERFEK